MWVRKMTTKVKHCERCNGTGKVSDYPAGWMGFGFTPAPANAKCPVCDGTGHIVEEVKSDGDKE